MKVRLPVPPPTRKRPGVDKNTPFEDELEDDLTIEEIFAILEQEEEDESE